MLVVPNSKEGFSMETRESGTQVEPDVQKAVRMAIAATEKKDYRTALTLFTRVYENPAFEAPPDGLSHYGLCVAIGERQTRRGVDLCRQGMKQQFYDSTHHANLVRLHLARRNRKLAVVALDEALQSLPGDTRLQDLRLEIGYRTHTPIPFLPRSSAINRWLGIRRRGSGTRLESSGHVGEASTWSLQSLQPLQMMIAGFLAFATVFSITFYVLYQQAYG
jgi:hypothetical protein